MHLKIESEEELVNIFKELMHLSVNMRHWQKEWKEHYGAANRLAKEKWEERMDKFIEKLNVEYQNPGKLRAKRAVSIEFKDQQTTA